MKRATFLPKLLIYIILGIILTTTIILAQQSDPCIISITTPNAGESVGREIMVKGKAEIPRGNYLWVLARRTDFKPLWWPQREAEIDPKNQQWSATAVLGGPQDAGKYFDIGVIAVDAKSHALLRQYWIKAMKTGEWRPIEIPPASCPPITLKVKKINH